MRIALLLLSIFSLPVWSGIIEHQAKRTLPAMGKTIFMFGEEHTDPFEPAALAQREELATSLDAIGKAYEGPISCYLECDCNVQKGLQQAPYFYNRNVADHGAYFEQWYVPLARTFGQEVGVGRMAISNFDIRDNQYAHFEHHLQALADGEITRDQVNFNALRTWGKNIDGTIQKLFDDIQAHYPKKMISYIKHDMESKKKQFHAMIDTHLQSTKRARFTYRALNQFYNYTDLLADFTILNKVATDPRKTIVVHAGSAHTENLTRYLNLL